MELKPCPFCGKKSMTMETNRQWMGLVCDECGGSAKWDLGVSGAEENWNTRPIEDALQSKLDIAVEALKGMYLEFGSTFPDDVSMAVDMAREALKKLNREE